MAEPDGNGTFRRAQPEVFMLFETMWTNSVAFVLLIYRKGEKMKMYYLTQCMDYLINRPFLIS